MDEVTIRRAVTADLPGVASLADEVDDLHRDALPWLLREVDEPTRTDFLEPYVSRADHVMFIAQARDGSLAGALWLFLRQPHRAPMVRPTIVAELDALVVARAFRRRRVATRLVEAALRWAEEAQATRTELGVYEFNDSARAFWQSVGFQTLSRRLVLHSRAEP